MLKQLNIYSLQLKSFILENNEKSIIYVYSFFFFYYKSPKKIKLNSLLILFLIQFQFIFHFLYFLIFLFPFKPVLHLIKPLVNFIIKGNKNHHPRLLFIDF